MFDIQTRRCTFEGIAKTILTWIIEDNPKCSAAFICLSEQLPLSKDEIQRITQIIKLYDRVFSDKYEDAKKQNQALIPDSCKIDTQTAFAYVLLQAVINFINAGMYSTAYDIARSIASVWEDIYKKIIFEISRHPNKEDFVKWCAVHSMIGMDVSGTQVLDYGSLICAYSPTAFQSPTDVDD